MNAGPRGTTCQSNHEHFYAVTLPAIATTKIIPRVKNGGCAQTVQYRNFNHNLGSQGSFWIRCLSPADANDDDNLSRVTRLGCFIGPFSRKQDVNLVCNCHNEIIIIIP